MIQEIETQYTPKQITFTRNVREAIKKAFIDAIAGAFAVTALVAFTII